MGYFVASGMTRIRNRAARRVHRGLLLLLGIVLIVSLVTPGMAGSRVTAQDSGSSDAAMFRGNPARTGELPGPGPDPGEPIVRHWSFETDGFIAASPAVADGVVYISSTDGYLYAIDAATGRANWSFEIGYSKASPAVAGGVVYVGGLRNTLYAIDAATGEQIWQALGDSYDGIVSSPAIVDGVVYVGSAADGNFYALDAATGQVEWSARVGYVNASPAVVDGVVYVIQKSLNVFAFDAATGEQHWMFEAGNLIYSYLTSPAVADDTVYAFSNYDGYLYAIDTASGQARWEFHIPITDSAFNSLNASPAVANGTVYLGGSDGLFAIDAATGQERWIFAADGMLDSSPVVVDGIVYAASSNAFYAIDAETGQQAWATPSDYDIVSSPAIANGVIYLAFGSRLVAFGNPTPDMRTATAEAETAATAQANLRATEIAIAGATATAQAQLDATATTIAGATATIEAHAMATAEAIQLAWQQYLWTDIRDAFSAEVEKMPGMSVLDHGGRDSSHSLIPEGSSRGAQYLVMIAGGSASASVTLQIFPSKKDADTAMETMSGGLVRSGWESRKGKGLDHNNACLTVQQMSFSEAVCYMTRDDALIISYSTVSQPNPDPALLNAIDLAKAMDAAYDRVDRPD